MKNIVILITVVLITISASKKHDHNIKSAVNHFNLPSEQVEKSIFRDVLVDKDIAKFIADGKTNTPEYQNTITKKTLTIIAKNDEYLKYLAQKVFSNSRIKINQYEKLKILQLVLRDDKFIDLIVQKKSQSQIINRCKELISGYGGLLQSIANEAFKENDVGRLLSEQQRLSLIKDLLNYPEWFQKGKVPNSTLKNIINCIQQDSNIRSFFNFHKEEFIEKLLKSS